MNFCCSFYFLARMYKHIPVLLNEVIEILQPKTGEMFLDGTLGGGGYSKAILEKVAPTGKVLSIDLDDDAIKNFKGQILNSKYKKNSVIVHGNFRDIDAIVKTHEFRNISGIVADLGLSSYELEQSGRGITFQKKEPLDMRFDQKKHTETAAFILNNYEEKQLVNIFKEFGEEPFARLIARGIIRARQESSVRFTTELADVITKSVPAKFRHKAKDSMRRVFQALRIAVNHELENLEQFLPKALELLNPGGKLAIVSFHSLESRMVKEFFVKASKGCICPPDFPICVCGRNPAAKLITRKPITAGKKELQDNPRSKSAELRAIIKL